MGKSQRVKGAVFEREIADIFSISFGKEFKRNIGQARDGGNDLDVGYLVVEMKRRASFKVLRSWLAQATKAATERLRVARSQIITQNDTRWDHIPVVVMREDGETSSMVLLSLDDFIYLAGDGIRDSIQ